MNFLRTVRVIMLPAVMMANVAAHEAGDAKAVLESAIADFMSVAYATAPSDQPLAERVKPVLSKYINFDTVTARAVGPAWRRFSDEEKSKTIALFTGVVLRTYAKNFTPDERPRIEYGAVTNLSATRREIATTVGYGGETYAVSYRMENRNGVWTIYDVIAEGVSMIANYRAQFDPIVQKGGAQALLRSLEENLSSVSTQS